MVQVDYDLVLESLDIGINEELLFRLQHCNFLTHRRMAWN